MLPLKLFKSNVKYPSIHRSHFHCPVVNFSTTFGLGSSIRILLITFLRVTSALHVKNAQTAAVIQVILDNCYLHHVTLK